MRFKDGGSVTLLRPQQDPHRAEIEDRVRDCLDAMGSHDFAGFAFVVWDEDGGHVVDHATMTQAVTKVMLPDFVREVLCASRIDRWTRDR